jgi:hypothetical protein
MRSIIFDSLSEDCKSILVNFADDQKETVHVPLTDCKVLGCKAQLHTEEYTFSKSLYLECRDEKFGNYLKLKTFWKLITKDVNQLCKSVLKSEGMQFSRMVHNSEMAFRYLHIAVFKEHAMLIECHGISDICLDIHRYGRSTPHIQILMETTAACLDIQFPNHTNIDIILEQSKKDNLNWKNEKTAVVRRGHAVAFASGQHPGPGRKSVLLDFPEDLLKEIYLKYEQSILLSTFEVFSILKDWLNSDSHASSSMAAVCCAVCKKLILNNSNAQHHPL